MAPRITLLLLAGGLGSRFGGPKQLEPLGPDGATLMDYAVYDAWRLGFARAVFVVRAELLDRFTTEILPPYRGRIEATTVVQRLDDLPAGFGVPPGRTKPWGTTQAVLAARKELTGPFVVLNADDFYGHDALRAVAAALETTEAGSEHHAVVGYRLDATTTAAGGVNRAVLEPNPDGTVRRIAEVQDLTVRQDGRYEGRLGDSALIVAGDTLVSMNLWGFHSSVLPVLSDDFAGFLARHPGDRDECYLPATVGGAIAAGRAVVDILRSTDRWCGVTYPADREPVRRFLAEQVERGAYPRRLWDS